MKACNFYWIQILTVMILCTLLLTCKSEQSEPETTEQEINSTDNVINAADIAAIQYTDYGLSDSAEEVTKDWLKFQELFEKMELLKKADLSFFSDDKTILRAFIDDLKNEVPESLNEPSIIVRMIAMETAFYKLEGLAIIPNAEKEDLLNAIGEALISHTNLIFQINKKLEKDNQNIEKPR